MPFSHSLGSDLFRAPFAALAMLSLLSSSAAFQGPAMMAGGRSTAVQMRAEGEIGVTPPLGVYDPLNISRIDRGCHAPP